MTDTTGTTAPTSVAAPHTADDFDPEPPASTDDQQGDPAGDESQLGDAGKKALEAERARLREETKRRKAVERELQSFREASLTDSERAISEAEARGRQAAAGEYGQRLARAQFDALASKRNPDADTSKILEFVDMSRFLTEEGEVDDRALKNAVSRLVPEVDKQDPSFDGGARQTGPKKSNMNDIIRAQAGLGRSA